MGRVFSFTLLVLLLALALILSGCVDKGSNSRGGRNQAPPAQSPSTQAPDLTGSKSGKPNDQITTAALKVMAQLGYDTSKLTANSTLLQGNSLSWQVKFSDASGDIAILMIDETTLRPIMFSTKTKAGDIVPPSLRSGDIPSQAAAALGLETQGYRRVTWLPGWKPAEHAEYRKYATFGQFEIAISLITILSPASAPIPIMIKWREEDLAPNLDIRVPRDKAIAAAAAFLHVQNTEPTHVDLVQLESDPRNPADAHVYWELVMGGHVARVRVDDGSILGENVPEPPPPI